MDTTQTVIIDFHSLEVMLLQLAASFRFDDPLYLSLLKKNKPLAPNGFGFGEIEVVACVQHVLPGTIYQTSVRVARYNTTADALPLHPESEKIAEAARGVDDLLRDMLARDGFTNVVPATVATPSGIEHVRGDCERLRYDEHTKRYRLEYKPLPLDQYISERAAARRKREVTA